VRRLVQILGIVLFLILPPLEFVILDRVLRQRSLSWGGLLIVVVPLLLGTISGLLVRSWRFIALMALLLVTGFVYGVVTQNLGVLLLLLYAPALLGVALGTMLAGMRDAGDEERAGRALRR
jgi:hypothetical protein